MSITSAWERSNEMLDETLALLGPAFAQVKDALLKAIKEQRPIEAILGQMEEATLASMLELFPKAISSASPLLEEVGLSVPPVSRRAQLTFGMQARSALQEVLGKGSPINKALVGLIQEVASSPIRPDQVARAASELIEAPIAQAKTIANTTLAGLQRQTTTQAADALPGEAIYLYVGPDDSATRPFCKKLVGKAITEADLKKLKNGQGLPVKSYGGGYNCRHSLIPITMEYAAAAGIEGYGGLKIEKPPAKKPTHQLDAEDFGIPAPPKFMPKASMPPPMPDFGGLDDLGIPAPPPLPKAVKAPIPPPPIDFGADLGIPSPPKFVPPKQPAPPKQTAPKKEKKAKAPKEQAAPKSIEQRLSEIKAAQATRRTTLGLDGIQAKDYEARKEAVRAKLGEDVYDRGEKAITGWTTSSNPFEVDEGRDAKKGRYVRYLSIQAGLTTIEEELATLERFYGGAGASKRALSKFKKEYEQSITEGTEEWSTLQVLQAQQLIWADAMRAQGITHIKVLRGLTMGSEAEADRLVKNPRELKMSAAASFTTSEQIASGFTGPHRARGVIVEAEVPIEQCLLGWQTHTGVGLQFAGRNEFEVVVGSLEGASYTIRRIE